MTDIFAAASVGDAELVATLLQADPQLAHGQNDRKRTALHYAAREGHAGIVRMLLEAGAHPHCVVYPNKEITLPRTLASERGHADVVSVLDTWAVESKPNTASHLGEAMCAAASVGALDRVQTLAQHPEVLQTTDHQGNTALHIAAAHGHRPLVLALLDMGADPNARNSDKLTPIHRALGKHIFDARKPDLTIAGTLLARGAQCDLWTACALGDIATMEALAATKPDDIHRDQPSAPITIAAMIGQLDAVQWLLEHGADPNTPHLLDPDSPTPYREQGAPLLAATLNQHGTVVRALLEGGADPNTTLMATPNAASEAYKRGYEDIAADLFSYGGIPDANACLARGNYAAVLQAFLYDPEVASKQLLTLGNPDLVRTCLQHEPKFTPSEQFKILFDYMRLNSSDIQRARERAQIMNMLLDYGFDPNLRDQENMSLLHRAVGCMWRGRWMNSQDVMIVFTDILLDHGADINAKDDDLKSTPLAWHARYGHEQVVGFLLSRGAATNLADDEPWATPLAWAQKKGHEGITALFQ